MDPVGCAMAAQFCSTTLEEPYFYGGTFAVSEALISNDPVFTLLRA